MYRSWLHCLGGRDVSRGDSANKGVKCVMDVRYLQASSYFQGKLHCEEWCRGLRVAGEDWVLEGVYVTRDGRGLLLPPHAVCSSSKVRHVLFVLLVVLQPISVEYFCLSDCTVNTSECTESKRVLICVSISVYLLLWSFTHWSVVIFLRPYANQWQKLNFLTPDP